MLHVEVSSGCFGRSIPWWLDQTPRNGGNHREDSAFKRMRRRKSVCGGCAGVLCLVLILGGCGGQAPGTTTTVIERVPAYPHSNNYGGTICPDGHVNNYGGEC